MQRNTQVTAFRLRYQLSRFHLAELMECHVNQIARIEAGEQLSDAWWEKFCMVREAYGRKHMQAQTARQTRSEILTMLRIQDTMR